MEILPLMQKLYQELPLMQKLNQEFLSRKRGIILLNMQIRVMGIVPIMLDNHREQV
jgi:hypothetical protein